MFEKFDEAANDVLSASRHEAMRLRCASVGPEHLLLALTRDQMNIAARALASMNVSAEHVQEEVEKALRAGGKIEPEPPVGMSSYLEYASIGFAETVRHVFDRANDFRLYFGRDKVAPEHLLLAMIDLNDEASLHVLEELGSNLTFLRRQVLSLVAQEDVMLVEAPSAKLTVIAGIAQIVWMQQESISSLRRLAAASKTDLPKLPDRAEIVLMVLLAYLPDFLMMQVAYQRYLLEETLRLLVKRTGSVEKECVATIVSSAAQNLRMDARSIIEHLWTQEYKSLSVPDEAEHEEIGGIIEDLWWTYSEEIALHDVFDEALNDHRKARVMDLQKRKIEIVQRLSKTRAHLEDALKRCFMKRKMSA